MFASKAVSWFSLSDLQCVRRSALEEKLDFINCQWKALVATFAMTYKKDPQEKRY